MQFQNDIVFTDWVLRLVAHEAIIEKYNGITEMIVKYFRITNWEKP